MDAEKEDKIFNLYRLKSIIEGFLMHAFLVLVSASCILPLLWMLGTALKTQQTVFSDLSLFPKNPQWHNFYEAWTRGHFNIYFLNSVFYTIVVFIGIVLISSL